MSEFDPGGEEYSGVFGHALVKRFLAAISELGMIIYRSALILFGIVMVLLIDICIGSVGIHTVIKYGVPGFSAGTICWAFSSGTSAIQLCAWELIISRRTGRVSGNRVVRLGAWIAVLAVIGVDTMIDVSVIQYLNTHQIPTTILPPHPTVIYLGVVFIAFCFAAFDTAILVFLLQTLKAENDPGYKGWVKRLGNRNRRGGGGGGGFGPPDMPYGYGEDWPT